MFRYRSAGLIIDSEFTLPLWSEAEEGGVPDMVFRRASLPERLETPSLSNEWWDMMPGRILYRHVSPDKIRVLICDGREILVDTDNLGVEGRAFLVGTALGTALHQRGAMLLHGAVVAIADRAFVFLGNSGSGKSTLAAALVRRGYPLLADDLCVVSFDAAGRALAHGDGRRLKVSASVANSLGLRSIGEPVGAEVYIDAPTLLGPLPVSALYEVIPNSTVGMGLVRQSRVESFDVLREHAFSHRIVRVSGHEEAYFFQCARLLKAATIFTLNRPQVLEQMPELLDLLDHHWADATNLRPFAGTRAAASFVRIKLHDR